MFFFLEFVLYLKHITDQKQQQTKVQNVLNKGKKKTTVYKNKNMIKNNNIFLDKTLNFIRNIIYDSIT